MSDNKAELFPFTPEIVDASISACQYLSHTSTVVSEDLMSQLYGHIEQVGINQMQLILDGF
jgi:hypothetical protein